MTGLHQTDTLPDGFLEVSARELHRLLPQPTLIHLPGERTDRLLVTILQHGNEDTGLTAIQQLLRELGNTPLPRTLSLFVSNVAAARDGVRRLPTQTDYNRAWPGTDYPASDETRLMAEVVEVMAGCQLFAAIDVHNNTGNNPHYAAINVLERGTVQLARLFSNTMVHFMRPHGVMTQAFSARCPAVILECGKVGNLAGVQHAKSFIETSLHLERIPDEPLDSNEVNLFESVAQVRVHDDVTFGFGDHEAQLSLDPELDRYNFRELAVGTGLGRCAVDLPRALTALDPAGNDVVTRYFTADDGDLSVARHLMLSMLTLDVRVIRQDCLCYIMERFDGPIG